MFSRSFFLPLSTNMHPRILVSRPEGPFKIIWYNPCILQMKVGPRKFCYCHVTVMIHDMGLHGPHSYSHWLLCVFCLYWMANGTDSCYSIMQACGFGRKATMFMFQHCLFPAMLKLSNTSVSLFMHFCCILSFRLFPRCYVYVYLCKHLLIAFPLDCEFSGNIS